MFQCYPLFLTAYIIWESHIWQDKAACTQSKRLDKLQYFYVVVIETVTVGGTGLEVRQEIATLPSPAVHKRYRIKDTCVRTGVGRERERELEWL